MGNRKSYRGGLEMSFNDMEWVLQLDKRPLSESVEVVLDAALDESEYRKCKGILRVLESLQWIKGGLEYLDDGYKEDNAIKEKFEKIHDKLVDMEKTLWPEG